MIELPTGHKYIWLYTDATIEQTKRHLGRCAADPNHPLTWLQAAHLTKLMRAQEMKEQWGQPGNLADLDFSNNETTDGGWDYTNDALDQRDED